MPEKSTVKSNIQNIVQLALGALLGSIFVFGMAGTYQVRESNRNMSRVVEVFIAKIGLANRMRDSIRLRQIGLNRLLTLTDAFSRDEELIKYYEYAGQYRNARSELVRLPMNQEETAIHDALTAITRVAQPLNKKAAELIANEAPPAEVTRVVTAAINEQQNLLVLLDKLIRLQNEYASGALLDGGKEYDHTLLVLLLIGVFVLMGALFIVRVLSRYIAENNKRLHDTNEDLARAINEALGANQAKSSFLATISHEIRTPLTAIIGFAERSADSICDQAEHSLANKKIIRSGNHLLQIINDILDLSKIEAHKLDLELLETSIFEVIHDVESLMRPQVESKGLDFRIEYQFPIPSSVIVDALRLKQILFNLCSNALKFTESGHIVIQVMFDASTNQLIFCVIDSGIGMTNQQISRIFDVFSQADSSISRKYGGTGLGLSLVKQLSEAMGGRVCVKSLPGTGSQFTVTLDVGDIGRFDFVTAVDQIPDIDDSLEREELVIPLSGKILLADDNNDNQQLISYFIEKMGPSVDIADNGKIATELIKKYPFDLVLMDMQMPVMSGVAATKAIRRAGFEIPIVALTANASKADKETCFAAGCNEFLSKPVDRQKLYQILSQYLEKRYDSNDTDTIHSLLLEKEPEFIDMITAYCHRLPGVLDEIKHHYRLNDLDSVRSISHDLKGTGSNMGYPLISEVSGKLEESIIDGEQELDVWIHRLENIIARISQDYSDMQTLQTKRNIDTDADMDGVA